MQPRTGAEAGTEVTLVAVTVGVMVPVHNIIAGSRLVLAIRGAGVPTKALTQLASVLTQLASVSWARSLSRALVRSREICICETPTCSAIWDCVRLP